MTVALSVATFRMAKRHVIVRRLTAVEGLGSCTYIATDKTGTLTVNQQTVKKVVLPFGAHFSVTGEGYTGEGEVVPESDGSLSPETIAQLRRLGTAGVLCNEAHLTCEKGEWDSHGDPIDVALLALAEGILPAQDGEGLFEEHHLPVLTLLGVIGAIDPLRPEVKDAVTECRNAGVQVAMVTGAHPATALSTWDWLPSLPGIGS